MPVRSRRQSASRSSWGLQVARSSAGRPSRNAHPGRAKVRRMPTDGAGAISPARVCAELGPLLFDERRQRIDEAAGSRLGGLRGVIENLHDPHNVAAVLRSAEAFGIQRVEVIENVEPFRYSSTVTQG